MKFHSIVIMKCITPWSKGNMHWSGEQTVSHRLGPENQSNPTRIKPSRCMIEDYLGKRNFWNYKIIWYSNFVENATRYLDHIRINSRSWNLKMERVTSLYHRHFVNSYRFFWRWKNNSKMFIIQFFENNFPAKESWEDSIQLHV